MGFGIRQPFLEGRIEIRRDRPVAADQVRDFLSRVVEPEETHGEGGREIPSLDLLDGILKTHLELQRLANLPVFGPWHSFPARTEARDVFLEAHDLFLPYSFPRASVDTLRWLESLINAFARSPAAVNNRLEEIRKSRDQLISQLSVFGLKGTNNFYFAKAAHELALPAIRIDSNIMAIGQGASTRWIDSSLTDQAPFMSVALAKDKERTALFLNHHGLPGPTHKVCRSEEEAIRLAGDLGYPVVIKPADQEQGRGVFAGLRDEQSVALAYREAAKLSRKILVEKFIFGEDYRFTVAHGQIVKIMHRVPGRVIGDGMTTIDGLVAREQGTERSQKILRMSGKMRLELDAEAQMLLTHQGLSSESIPEEGRVVRLRGKANISAGGSHILIAHEQVHPENLELALQVARTFRLDIAGIDLIIPDVKASWKDRGGIICEVNAQPQIGIRDTPMIYREILASMFQSAESVVLHLLVNPDGMETGILHREAQRLLQQLNCNGLALAEGVWIAGKALACQPSSGFSAAQSMIHDQALTSGLIVMSVSEILQRGLPAPEFATGTLLGLAAKVSHASRRILRLVKPHVDDLRRPDCADMDLA
ncbi:MAG: hypothetical protein QUV06_06000 [Cyanobium sp. CZS 48M]|nr:hypothetical protein [Cyanobium sp. CZS48M]